jgi:hypothetical protein
MKCPHCLVTFHDAWSEPAPLGADRDGPWEIKINRCPTCKRFIIVLNKPKAVHGFPIHEDMMVWPKGISRAPLSNDVPEEFAEEYREACVVLSDSPKASAALSRRCLQRLLREKAQTKARDLDKQIQEVLDAKSLPSHLAEAIDAVRATGNFAAHPIKSTNTGEIIPVEPGEAEWQLDTLEGLFDFYFVQPSIIQRKRAQLDAKLKEAAKPLLKK